MKKINKTILLLISIFVCSIIANASLNSYFGRIDSEIKVEQSITIDKLPVTNPINHKIKLMSGDSATYKHTIYNKAKTCNVSINQTTTGLTSGLTLTILYKNNTEVVFPFNLSSGEKVKLQFIYDTDVNLKAKTYNVKTYFYVEEI